MVIVLLLMTSLQSAASPELSAQLSRLGTARRDFPSVSAPSPKGRKRSIGLDPWSVHGGLEASTEIIFPAGSADERLLLNSWGSRLTLSLAKREGKGAKKLWAIELQQIPPEKARSSLRKAKGTLLRWMLRRGFTASQKQPAKVRQYLELTQPYAHYSLEHVSTTFTISLIRENGTSSPGEEWPYLTVTDPRGTPWHPFKIPTEERQLLRDRLGLPAALRGRIG